jgi:hypothetical protein
VQVGAYEIEANTKAAVSALKSAGGSDAFISKDEGTASSVQIGERSKVKVKAGAKTYTGGGIDNFVFKDTWIVKEIKGERAVIDKNVSGTNAICTPVNVKDLILA